MKRFTQIVSLVLVLSMVLVIPAYAAEGNTRASNYFLSRSCYLYKTSGTSFQVCFDVVAVGQMNELGANEIRVQRSLDGVNWTTVKTYSRSSYPNLVASNTGEHGSNVTFSNVSSGYYYRAYVEFYAKNSSGTAYYNSYTSSLRY